MQRRGATCRREPDRDLAWRSLSLQLREQSIVMVAELHSHVIGCVAEAGVIGSGETLADTEVEPATGQRVDKCGAFGDAKPQLVIYL